MRAAKSWRLLAVLAVGTQAWLLRAPPAVPLGKPVLPFLRKFSGHATR